MSKVRAIKITFRHGKEKWARDFTSWDELVSYMEHTGRPHFPAFRIELVKEAADARKQR